jgi:Rapid ALkalinization Factor (RALF)
VRVSHSKLQVLCEALNQTPRLHGENSSRSTSSSPKNLSTINYTTMARSYLLLLIFFSSLFSSLPVFAHSLQSNGLDLDLNFIRKSDAFNLSYEEHTRRVLANSRYISYGALRRDSVPCSYRGASYYNCRPGAHANPYARGCSAITRCRR